MPVRDPIMHPLKKNTHRRILRVCSESRLPSQTKYFNEIKPLTHRDV